MTVDLDQGGHPFQKTRVYLGPSLGWIDQQVLPERQIDGSGVIEIAPGDSVILLSADGPTRLNLPDVRAWTRQTANQPATGFARAIWIKDFAGKATTFPIVMFPFGSQVIDGVFQSVTFTSNYQTITFYPLEDESGWYTVVQSAGGAGGGGVTNLNATAPLSGTIVGPVLNINIAYDANFALAGGQLALAFAPSGSILANANPTPQEPVPTTLTNLFDRVYGTAQGTILFRSASAWVPLPPGTSGQFLSTGGTTGNPAWQTVTPGGAGNVSNSGSPTNGQWAQWVDNTHIQGIDTAAMPFQPLDGDLSAIAALTGTNTIYYRSGLNTWSGVTIGSNLTFTGGVLSATGGSGGVPEAPTDGKLYLRQGAPANWIDNTLVNQPADGDLTALAGLTGTNTIYYRSGASIWSPVNIGSGLSFGGGTLSAIGLADGDKGDIIVSGTGTVWTIDQKAVDTTKMADMPQGTLVGRLGGAGTGQPGYISPSQALDVIGSNQGMLLYRAGSGWAAIPAGLNGQLLQTQGVGNNPVWVTPPTGATLTISDTPPASPSQGQLWWESDTGKLYVSYNDGNSTQWVGVQPALGPAPDPAMVLLDTITPSGVNQQAVNLQQYGNKYEAIEFGLWINPSVTNTYLILQASVDGGATYLSGAGYYHNAFQYAFADNTSGQGGNSGTFMQLSNRTIQPNYPIHGSMKIWRPWATAGKMFEGKMFSAVASGYGGFFNFGSALMGVITPITHVLFGFGDAATFVAGSQIKVYGIR